MRLILVLVLGRCVATQFVVASDLRFGEKSAGHEVGREVDCSELALERGDRSDPGAPEPGDGPSRRDALDRWRAILQVPGDGQSPPSRWLENRADDLRVLERVRENLRPGGVFVIEMVSKERLARNFQATTSSALPGDVLFERHEIVDDWTRVPIAGR